MKLGGLQRTTLSDFPGRVACAVFTVGCNLRCPYCHNPSLIDGEPALSETEFFAFLDDRQAVLDGVVISGGEPTIHDDLPSFAERIADRELDVKLDTNGTRPEVLSAVLDTGAVDYVAMDLKTVPRRYHELGADRSTGRAVERSARLVRERAPEFAFRTTFDPGVVKATDFARLADLAGDGPLYVQSVATDGVLAPERVTPTPPRPLASIRVAAGSVPAPIERRDGID